jgi:hypothetical protein
MIKGKVVKNDRRVFFGNRTLGFLLMLRSLLFIFTLFFGTEST